MGDFRRVVTALVFLALFAGLASAQYSCTGTVAVPGQIRTEGQTELAGDIVITCTTALAPPTAGAAITTLANISVTTTVPITSRVIGTTSNLSLPVVDALLLLDEPTTLTYCGGSAAASPATAGVGCSYTVGAAPLMTPSANAFFGVQTTTGTQTVTFFNVPVVPPATAGGTRTFRITNIRLDGTKAGGNVNTPGQVIGSVSVTSPSGLALNNPNQIIAFAQPGLTGAPGSTSPTTTFSTVSAQQCVSTSDSGATRAVIGTLDYSEGFGTAFKIRSLAGAVTPPTNQAVPGQIINNTESGFVIPTVVGSFYPGFADSGTRLKATFNNVPTGVRIYVSTTNLLANSSSVNVNTLGNLVSNSIAGTGLGTKSLAVYIPSETFQMFPGYPIPNNGDVFSGLPSALNVGVGVVEVPITNGTGTAVWEVIDSTASLEQLRFAVAIRYAASPTTNSPATGLSPATVTMSFAPTGSTTWIPRFSTGGASAQNLFQVIACRTILMYPYVTNQVGFDTGIAIANTSTDPFGTLAQAGTCTLNFYGNTPPNQPFTTAQAVASGDVYATLLSTVAPGFQGYIIAVCNFQFAHGFAFISDRNAINLAMGYLALVIPDPGTSARQARPTQSGASSEVLGQ